MKKYLVVVAATLFMLACSKDGGLSFSHDDDRYAEELTHGMIVLGDKLDNPYKTENVRDAYVSVYPTKSRDEISTNNLYVRFLPADETEFDMLVDRGVEMLDHPVDYEIIQEGDYYRDPSIAEDDITWQYALVPVGFDFPDVKYEILDECYLADEATRADRDIDWDAVETEAYRLSGNGDMIMETKSDKVQPSGRITIVDENANGGKPFGVAGVRVSCNTFVKFSSAYTDRDGYYTIPKKFAAKVRYRLVFKNEKGFALGLNLLLVPASVSTLGKSSPDGISVTITGDSDSKLYRRAAVNNAAYDYITRCSAEDMNIASPPKDLRIWLFKGLSASSAVMMHHGALVRNEQIERYLGEFSGILEFFAPDITIGVKDHYSYMELYDSVCHELAHATHFSEVGTEYWDKYIFYIMESYLKSGGETYGSGDLPDAGYCEVGEMWAYYMESMMHKDRYGGPVPAYGTSFWFYPQIFRYLDERGINRDDIFDALDADVTDRNRLQKRLTALYPFRSVMIEQAFNRYR